jgi:hypothetical protein
MHFPSVVVLGRNRCAFSTDALVPRHRRDEPQLAAFRTSLSKAFLVPGAGIEPRLDDHHVTMKPQRVATRVELRPLRLFWCPESGSNRHTFSGEGF